MRRLFLIVLIGLLLASCTNEQTIEQMTTEQIKQEEAKLLDTSRKWSNSFSTDAYFSFIGEDGVMMAPDQPLLRGHEEIRKVMAQFLSIPGFSVKWEPQEAFIAKGGDLGYTIDKLLVNYDGEDGNTVNQFEKVVAIWKKNEEGEWKVAVDIWNSDPTLTSINK